MKKSYHSMVVPMKLAKITGRIDFIVCSATGGEETISAVWTAMITPL
jgi:hypothetical protein